MAVLGTTEYGDISPRTASKIVRELLKRADPDIVLEKFGQAKEIGKGETKTITFRRYESLGLAMTTLTEGVTPTAQQLVSTDVVANLSQYGGRVTMSDQITDHHEDPVLKEATEILGEQSAQTLETARFYVVRGGTNAVYANGAQRNAVNTVATKAGFRSCIKALQRQNAKKLTTIVSSKVDYNTFSVLPSYYAACHTDCEGDIRDIPGFISAADYGTKPTMENEIGVVEKVRIVTSTLLTAFADGGGTASTNSTESTTGTSSDVYPILIFGKNAFGVVPFKGMGAVKPMVVNAKPSDSDPLGQRSHVSWKASHTAVILNDLWMIRYEVAATA